MINKFRRVPKRNFLFALYLLVLAAGGRSVVHAQTATQLYSEGVQAYRQGNTTLAKQKFDQTLLVDKNFRPASIFLSRMEQDTQKSGSPAPGISLKALESTVVPIEFKDTTLNSALEYIRQKAAEQSGGKLLINFVVNLPPELASKHVTLTLAHVPVSEALRYLGGLAGVNFDMQRYAIVVTPAGAPAAATATPLTTVSP